MRDVDATIEWYAEHRVYPTSLGFDPDGMCLKICRTARDIPAKYPSALSAQLQTPEEYRVHDISKIRRGMVMFFDDPTDSNPYGHIVTCIGRERGADRSLLASVLVRTNSVLSNQIVVTRADYFPRNWGDDFQFAATWLNGVPLDMGGKSEAPKRKPGRLPNLRAARKELQEALEHHQEKGHARLAAALRRDIRELDETIEKFSAK